jgi:hypothetical protein
MPHYLQHNVRGVNFVTVNYCAPTRCTHQHIAPYWFKHQITKNDFAFINNNLGQSKTLARFMLVNMHTFVTYTFDARSSLLGDHHGGCRRTETD